MTDSQFGALCERLDGVKENTALALKLLNGNGEPEKGLMFRMAGIEKRFRRVDWLLKAAFVAIAGGVCTFLAELFLRPR